MFIPLWTIAIIVLFFSWPILLNINKARQIDVLQYSFYTLSDKSIYNLKEIKLQLSRDKENLVTLECIITDSIEEWEKTVDLCFKLQKNTGIQNYNLNTGARAMGLF